MVGLGLTTPKLDGLGTPKANETAGDVFGNGHRVDEVDLNRDEALDEVDQFLNEADEADGETRESSFDFSNGRIEIGKPGTRRHHSSTSSFAQSPGSHTSDPLLEVLDNDEDEEDEEGMEMFEDGDEEDFDTEQPLVGRRSGSRRGRRRWEGGERKKDSSLFEVCQSRLAIRNVC